LPAHRLPLRLALRPRAQRCSPHLTHLFYQPPLRRIRIPKLAFFVRYRAQRPFLSLSYLRMRSESLQQLFIFHRQAHLFLLLSGFPLSPLYSTAHQFESHLFQIVTLRCHPGMIEFHFPISETYHATPQ
jgi:hypothetical protein